LACLCGSAAHAAFDDTALQARARLVRANSLGAAALAVYASAAPAGFCDLEGTDTSGSVREIPQFLKQIRPHVGKDLVRNLARWSVSCKFSEGALIRAGAMLEHMYWNGVSDLAGMETADVAMFRNVFFELTATSIASLQLNESDLNESFGTADCNDFLAAPLLQQADFLKTMGKVVNAIEPDKRKVIDAIQRELQRREGSPSMFGDDLLKILQTPAELKLMNEFYTYLLVSARSPRKFKTTWHVTRGMEKTAGVGRG
jgi:hypothetical protein